jgi:hypothetical protein
MKTPIRFDGPMNKRQLPVAGNFIYGDLKKSEAD